jgi:hypothetical protein
MATNAGSPKETCPFKKTEEKEEVQEITKHWIKFKVIDLQGNPVPNVTIQFSLPPDNKSVVEKTSDETGLIEIKNIKPGMCKIESDWKDLEVFDTVLIQ